jgi:hypothetical protein
MDDGSIVCCASAASSVDSCPETQRSAGRWQRLEDIYVNVIGGFGWALNYSEYEVQAALASNLPSVMDSMLQIDPSTLPPTHLYIDDVVWDYAPE